MDAATTGLRGAMARLRPGRVARGLRSRAVALLRRSRTVRGLRSRAIALLHSREARAVRRRAAQSVRRGRSLQRRLAARRRGRHDAAPAWLPGLLAAVDGLRRPRRVVLVLGSDAVSAANAVREHLDGPEVHLLATQDIDTGHLRDGIDVVVAPDVEAQIAALSAMGVPDLIIERDTPASELSFRRLLPFLAPGGVFIIDGLDAVGPPTADAGSGLDVRRLVGLLDDAVHSPGRRPVAPHGDLAGLADAVQSVNLDVRRAIVVKRGKHRLKLRERTANAVLARRGNAWGSVLEVLPAEDYVPRAVVRHHGEGTSLNYRELVRVPERCLREYRDVTATSRQVVYDDQVYLPDSFRHTQSRLMHEALVSVDDYSARLAWSPPQPPRRLDGRYFYFDTEFPGHFGHVLTEVVGRAPGWLRAVERYPDIRPLVSLRRGHATVPGFQRDLFQALGIDTETIECIPYREAVQVESLVAMTPSWVMPGYAAPELAEVWGEMGRRLTGPGTTPTPRLFVSRRPSERRRCHRLAEVEAFFADEGFAVICPADLPFIEQVAMFRSTEVVAGFAGSGLFTMMFSGVQRRVLLSSASYTANNEYLIASVLGGTLDVFWGPADLPQPDNAYDPVAFQSDFDFDVELRGDELRRAFEG